MAPHQRAFASQLGIQYLQLLRSERQRDQLALIDHAKMITSIIYSATLNMDSIQDESLLQTTLWTACISELVTLMFLNKPLVLGEKLLPWWQRHLCEPDAEDTAKQLMAASEEAAHHEAFWPTIRALIVQGQPSKASLLLGLHPALAQSTDKFSGTVLGGTLLRLGTLLDNLPRLSEPALLQPIDEATHPTFAAQESLTAFRHCWRIWKQDVDGLVRDAAAASHSQPDAKGVHSAALILAGDQNALEDACQGSWHGLLIANLMYSQPTRQRWQLSELLPSAACVQRPEERILLAALSDNPYACMDAVRDTYGDDWLLAHLYDLLCRAGEIRVDESTPEGRLERNFFMIQYAKKIGQELPMWQLSLQYLAPLLDIPQARACAANFLENQPIPHVIKLRKILEACERLGLKETAINIVERHCQKNMPEPIQFDDTTLDITDEQSFKAASIEKIALRALDAVLSNDASEDALNKLRSLLRSGGAAGPMYFDGPSWLQPFASIVEQLYRDPSQHALLFSHITSLCCGESLNHSVCRWNDVPPPRLTRRLLLHLSELEPHRYDQTNECSSSEISSRRVRESYSLLALPKSMRGVTTFEDTEQSNTHTLVHSLAEAILRTVN